MPQKPKAFIVCVDYADLLQLTLPRNRAHFSEVYVITSTADAVTRAACARLPVDGLYATDAFYRFGAAFNKWMALEEGLSHFGRDGWICLLDADIVWPAVAELDLTAGNLYTPKRRIIEKLPSVIPSEEEWSRYPFYTEGEFAGYCQIFHGSDPVLGEPPWHQLDWAHAGGADSFFQAKWPKSKKVRPPFAVLHLGPADINWCGRVSPTFDGSRPAEAREREKRMKEFRLTRAKTRSYAHERLRLSKERDNSKKGE